MKGILNATKEGKSIRYKITNKRRVNKILNEHIEARKALEKNIRLPPCNIVRSTSPYFDIIQIFIPS